MTDMQTAADMFQSVAIIGSAGRFPGADTVDAFWSNLAAGIESIAQFDVEELRRRGVPEELLGHPSYVKAGARLPGAEEFDPDFFGMTQREAEITDPQHRVLLECAVEALENAGQTARRFPGSIAVYAGVGLNTYLINNLLPRPDLLRTLGMHQLLLGNDKCYATSRISYKLNLRGPSVTVDTACSSGLVAVILAYRSLISFECDMALAGGAKVNAADDGYVYEPGSINSPDGHCRAFDERAQGTVFGSGAGLVVMKRLEDALRDRDTIHAVIRGAAINNDGSDKVGFTAPSVKRQRDVINQALNFAEVDPTSISYVETHGTGTQLGDQVEIAALGEVFAAARPGSIAIGSVKPNVGHLETAAGTAGLIKVVEALRRGQLPPSLNVERPNPAIDFATSPFRVNTHLTDWTTDRLPRRACISSFGLGGTNAHLTLEEAPAVTDQPAAAPAELLLLSAKTPEALEEATRRLVEALERPDAPALANAAYTLACGRDHHRYRRFITAVPGRPVTAAGAERRLDQARETARLGLLIPGQGVQKAGMAAAAHAAEPTFREALDACISAMGPQGGTVRDLLLGRAVDGTLIDRTEFAQPAIFAAAYASARMWMARGLTPALMMGHSLGEYVAACLAGVFRLEDAVALVCARGRLMQALPAGAMASIALPEADVRALLASNPDWRCELAAVNAPTATVISGEERDVAACIAAAAAGGAQTRTLRTSHAFHSRMMDPILAEFRTLVGNLPLSAPRTPILSCVTGGLLSDKDAVSPDYWARQLRAPVRFADMMTAAAASVDTILDVGPSTVGTALALSNLGTASTKVATVTGLGDVRGDAEHTLAQADAMGRLWMRGHRLDWEAVYAGRGCRKVPLPTYPFQKRRCWVDPPQVQAPATAAPTAAAAAVAEPTPMSAPVSGAATAGPARAEDLEGIVAAIWTELLGVQTVQPDDNFFELGGQSLLAARVLTRIHEETGTELPVRAIFDAPTVAGLAAAILEQRAAEEDPELIARLLAEIERETAEMA